MKLLKNTLLDSWYFRTDLQRDSCPTFLEDTFEILVFCRKLATTSVTRERRPKCQSRKPHTTESVTTAQQQGKQGDHDNKKPVTPGRRIQEAWENARSTTKSRSSLQAGRRIKEPMGKRKSQQQTVPQETLKQHKRNPDQH